MRDGRVTRSPEFMLYALFVTTIVCILILCTLPRTLPPVDPPALVLDRGLVKAVEQADQKAHASAAKTPAALALVARFLELGDVENQTVANASSPSQQRQLLARAFQTCVRESGEPAILALRAGAVERLEAALRLQLSDVETERVLGMFPDALAQHAVTHDGIEVAPHFVMRTLYKARWNLAMGLAPDYKLAPVEQEAYHGWLALHATNLGPEARSLALQEYAAAGGRHVAEARGVLAFLAHDYKHAVAALEKAYQESPSLRLRNWLRGARFGVDTVNGGP